MADAELESEAQSESEAEPEAEPEAKPEADPELLYSVYHTLQWLESLSRLQLVMLSTRYDPIAALA